MILSIEQIFNIKNDFCNNIHLILDLILMGVNVSRDLLF